MIKIFIFMVFFLMISCSSSDNNVGSNVSTGAEGNTTTQSTKYITEPIKKAEDAKDTYNKRSEEIVLD